MRRYFKALGLALVAALAMSAVAASGASAQFSTGSHETVLTAKAETNQVFKTGAGDEVICAEVDVHSETLGTEETEITVEPTYPNPEHKPASEGGCTVIGSGGKEFVGTVNTNGCHYLFTHETEVVGSDGEVHIQCPEGAQIEVRALILGQFRNCLDIPAQTPTVPGVDYNAAEKEGKEAIELVSNVEGIKYEKTGNCGEGINNDAFYEGTVLVGGEDHLGNPVDVSWNETP